MPVRFDALLGRLLQRQWLLQAASLLLLGLVCFSRSAVWGGVYLLPAGLLLWHSFWCPSSLSDSCRGRGEALQRHVGLILLLLRLKHYHRQKRLQLCLDLLLACSSVAIGCTRRGDAFSCLYAAAVLLLLATALYSDYASRAARLAREYRRALHRCASAGAQH